MIHEQIKARRKAQNLKQDELAQRVGISRVQLGLIERGKATTIERLQKIAEVLGCEIEISLKCK